MQVQVLYRQEDGSFDHVANVDATTEISGAQDIKLATNWALQYAFRLCQNLNGSWSRGPEIEYLGIMHENFDQSPDVEVVLPLEIYNGLAYGHRSSMVGDRMIADGKIYEVDTFGFKEVEA